MSLDSTTQVDGRVTRARRAFRAWRKHRPFWGGLLMIFSGVFLYLASNLQPGALTVHVGLSGFLSYLLPLLMILTGALVWASPGQRVFYGIIGMITAIYSLIGNNLGGFLIGLLLGMFGSGLAAAWVPDKRVPTPVEGDQTVVDEQMGILDPADYARPAAEIPGPRHGADDDHTDPPRHPYDDDLPGSPRHATTESEGEQRDRFRGRHATDDGTARFSLIRSRSARPRLAALAAFAIAAGTIAVVNVQTAAPARADATGCTADEFKKTLTKGGTHGDGVGDIVWGVLGHLGMVAPTPSDSPSDNPTPTPTETPTEAPTEAPTPSDPPTPTPDPTKTAKPKPTDTPTEAPTPDPTKTTRPDPPAEPTPTPTPTLCPSSAPKILKADADQAIVSSNPSILTTDLLTISGLSFDGIVDLPTAGGGTIKVLKFSMSSTTQTPFTLVADQSRKSLTTTADKLTVSGNVSFFTSELKGNLLGLVPVDFTPDNPPPLVIPEIFFTGVTIKLVDVIGDKLTASNMAQIQS